MRHKLGKQGMMFGDQYATEIEIREREPSVPYGPVDKKGLRFWQRLRSQVMEMGDGRREAALVVLLSWPGEEREKLRKILNAHAKAQPMERDNFSEAMGW